MSEEMLGKVITREEFGRRASAVWPYCYNNPGLPVDPADVNALLKGLIDIHIHGSPAGAWSPGRQSSEQTVLEMSEFGVKALVFKDHYFPTNAYAILLNEANKKLAEEKAKNGETLTPTEIYGGIVLNDPVGGINAHAVDIALGYGNLVEVWLPSLNAKYQHEAIGKPGGIPVAENGELTADMKAVLDVMAQYNQNSEGKRVALSTCHVSNQEKFDILRYVKKKGMDVDIIMDHVTQELTLAGLDEAIEMIDLGGYLEFAETSCVPWVGMKDWIINYEYSYKLIKHCINKRGTDHIVCCSDSGQPGHPISIGWKSFLHTLLAEGISFDDIYVMTHDIPTKLTGIK